MSKQNPFKSHFVGLSIMIIGTVLLYRWSKQQIKEPPQSMEEAIKQNVFSYPQTIPATKPLDVEAERAANREEFKKNYEYNKRLFARFEPEMSQKEKFQFWRMAGHPCEDGFFILNGEKIKACKWCGKTSPDKYIELE